MKIEEEIKQGQKRKKTEPSSAVHRRDREEPDEFHRHDRFHILPGIIFKFFLYPFRLFSSRQDSMEFAPSRFFGYNFSFLGSIFQNVFFGRLTLLEQQRGVPDLISAARLGSPRPHFRVTVCSWICDYKVSSLATDAQLKAAPNFRKAVRFCGCSKTASTHQ